MSSNVDLACSLFAAWERGDFSSTEWADPEIEFVVSEGPSPGSWRGLRGMMEAWRERASVWQGLRVVADDLREIDDERVLVFTHLGGRGKTSGVQLGQVPTEQAIVLQIRDSRVTRLVVYDDRDRALVDLGVASEGGSP